MGSELFYIAKTFFKDIYLRVSKCSLRKDRKWNEYLAHRNGFYPAEIVERLKGKKIIALNANEGGDVLGMDPFIAMLKKNFRMPVLLCVDTFYAKEAAENKIKNAEGVVYLPWDVYRHVTHFMKNFNIALFLTVNYPLNPLLVKRLKQKGTVLGMLSGHFREEFIKRNQEYNERLLRHKTFKLYDFVIVKTEKDKKNVIKFFDAPLEKVKVAGSIKPALPKDSLAVSKEIKKKFGFNKHLIVAGAIREQEERIILEALLPFIKKDAKIVVAPRYFERIPAIQAWFAGNGIKTAKLSERNYSGEPVLISDVFGELEKFYAACDVAILGNSFFSPGGGQNVLEQMQYSKPVVFGLWTSNQDEFLEMIEKDYPWLRADGIKGIRTAVEKLFSNNKARRGISSASLSVVKKQAGAHKRYAALVRRLALATSESGAT